MATMDVLNPKNYTVERIIISCFIVSTMAENKDNEVDRSSECEETEHSSPEIELCELHFVVYILTSLCFCFD